ncbi:MAG: hypothetical protein EOO03_08115 [Chitinophagaceae bacterium]|nr:MAG: hypothetical protein EOO03_08115 [Chitinophagaceae bacterium]
METLLTEYLYECKHCPLPGIGSLQLQPGEAHFLPGEKRIIAPIPFIVLQAQELPAETLHQFIANRCRLSEGLAAQQLQQFCNGILSLNAYEEQPLADAGSFYMDETGKLHFKSLSLPAAYFPDVPAERVIHPDVPHEMLVGDTHTNTTDMTAMLQDEPVKKSRWWIAALIMAAIAIVALIAYYSNHRFSDTGNAVKARTNSPSKSYSTPADN